MNRKILLGIGALVVIGALIAAAFYFDFNPFKSAEEGPSLDVGVGTTPDSGNYTVQIDDSTYQEVKPNLDREIQYGATFPQEARDIIKSKIDATRARLKEDPNRADDWFQLAIYYHTVNDYEAAREVWEFLLKVTAAPGVAVVYDNLGKLHKFDVKDYAKSESYFKQSIVANPNSITPYLELFELYRYAYKMNTSAAVDIITEAGKKFSDTPDPYVLLGQYYRDKQEYVKARTAFETALDRARATGNVTQISAIGDELVRLPQ